MLILRAYSRMRITSATRYSSLLTSTPYAEIYTLSLHDALPICASLDAPTPKGCRRVADGVAIFIAPDDATALAARSEEHTSELQSLTNLVCRLLVEKKKRRTVSVIRPRTPTQYGSSQLIVCKLC